MLNKVRHVYSDHMDFKTNGKVVALRLATFVSQEDDYNVLAVFQPALILPRYKPTGFSESLKPVGLYLGDCYTFSRLIDNTTG